MIKLDLTKHKSIVTNFLIFNRTRSSNILPARDQHSADRLPASATVLPLSTHSYFPFRGIQVNE